MKSNASKRSSNRSRKPDFMSDKKEEILNNLAPQQKEEEFSFSVAGDNQIIQVRFADGVRVVPDYVVEGLGGPEKIKEVALALSTVTYDQFISGFYQTINRQNLNDFQQRFVANHFGKLGRFGF